MRPFSTPACTMARRMAASTMGRGPISLASSRSPRPCWPRAWSSRFGGCCTCQPQGWHFFKRSPLRRIVTEFLIGISVKSHTRATLETVFLRTARMLAFDPHTALYTLLNEYSARANAIRQDLARSHSPDFAEQALQRQNDEVLEALLAEAEAGMRQVGLAKLRLAEGRYGLCLRCAALRSSPGQRSPISLSRRRAAVSAASL